MSSSNIKVKPKGIVKITNTSDFVEPTQVYFIIFIYFIFKEMYSANS
jgi:hypothetical protein